MQHARAAEPPKDNSQYLSADYWNARFGRESSHEWLRSYQDFRQLLRVHLKASDRILIVGNGTSALPLDLAADGFVHVTATDLSPAAIQGMQRRQAEASRSDVQWQVADMLNLPFGDASFEVVIEKAALDCLLTDCKSQWDLPEAAKLRVHTMLTEVHRVLTSGGMFLSITFAQPHFRRPLLLATELSWNMQHTAFSQDGGMHHHFYALQKGARTDADVPVQLVGYSPESHAVEGGMSQPQVDSEDFMSFICV